MTDSEYFANPAISKSKLWKLKKSPAHFKFELDNPMKPTPAMTFGSALHCAVLEPDRFNLEYMVAPECDRRTKEGKAVFADFIASAEGKNVISSSDYETIKGMTESIKNTPLAVRYLTGEFEAPMFWKDIKTGEDCKGKCDVINRDNGFISDIKTCESASTRDFTYTTLSYGYDLQAAMYQIGVGAGLDFYFIAVEKKPPYHVNVLKTHQMTIEHGAAQYRQLLDLYHECKRTNNWYGYINGGCNELLIQKQEAFKNGDTSTDNRGVRQWEKLLDEEF